MKFTYIFLVFGRALLENIRLWLKAVKIISAKSSILNNWQGSE